MAYREFYQPIDQTVADYSYIPQGVTDLFRGIAMRDANRRKEADKFEYDLSQGKFENDQKILTELATNVITRGRNEIMNGGKTSNDTLNLANKGREYQQMSKIQYEKSKQLHDEILARETKDPFYNSSVDLMNLKRATNGDDGEVNFFSRGKRLSDFEKNIGRVTADPKTSTFKNIDYRQNYIKSLKDRYIETTSKNPNVVKSKYNQATFWDDEKNTPGVTDQHAVDYIKSDPRVDEYFSSIVGDQLNEEIKRMKASGDPRVSWMKGGTDLTGKANWLNDETIRAELIRDPSKNLINKKDFGLRKRDLAKEDLRKGDRVNSKVSVEYIAPKETKNPDGTNDSVAHGTTFISDTFRNNQTGPGTAMDATAQATGVVKPNLIAGPGGNLMTKKGVNPGKPIVTDFNSTNAFNYREGRNVKRPNGKFNLTGYQISAYDNNGNVVPIGAESTQEMITRINGMKPEDFATMAPDMKVSLKGYALDDTKMLGNVEKQIERLNEDKYQAEEDGDDEKVSRIETRINNLNRLRDFYNDPNAYDEDIINAALGSGIKEIRVDQLLMASKSDLDKLKDLTGLDLTDENKWSDDMKAVQGAYRRKFQEAQASGFKSPEATPQKKSRAKKQPAAESTSSNMVRVQAPDGRTGSIPKENLEAALKAGYKQL